MIYKSCDLIEHGLDFAQDSINFCCRTTTKGGGFKRLIDNYRGELLDLDKFFALKREYRNKMKSGEGIPECENCIYLETRDYDDEDYISSINFNQGMVCNLKCVYCSLAHGEKSEISNDYNVYPVIKQIVDAGKLRQGGFITIAGGEPTIGKGFEDLMRLFIDNDIHPVRVLTNGVKYSEALAEGLRFNIANTVISVDSGSPEMYKWIKGADVYYQVWENIAKYCQAQYQKGSVQTKYIIIPEINDDKEEIKKYFNQCEKFGLGGVSFDIELTWYGENRDKLPKELFELVEFTVDEAERRGLRYEPVDRVVNVLQEIKKQKSDLHVSFRGHDL